MSLVPYVVEQTNRGERSYDIFSRLLNNLRRIFPYINYHFFVVSSIKHFH